MPTARLFVRLNPVMLFADNEKAKSTPGFNRLKKIARAGSQVKPMLARRSARGGEDHMIS
jgi:hypothetical protein